LLHYTSINEKLQNLYLIANKDQENIYLSIIDWSGKIVAYPDPTEIGSKSYEQASGIVTTEGLKQIR